MISLFNVLLWIIAFSLCQPTPTAELDRSEDKVYQYVMDLVKVVVQLKNDVNTLPSTEYISLVKVTLESLKLFSDDVENCYKAPFWEKTDDIYPSVMFLYYDHFILFSYTCYSFNSLLEWLWGI